jgi:hypothetical protein
MIAGETSENSDSNKPGTSKFAVVKRNGHSTGETVEIPSNKIIFF